MRRQVRHALAAAVLGAALAAAPSATAATFTVNNVADQPATGSVNDLVCDSDPGAAVVCTLRAAIQEANGVAGNDTVNLPNLGAPYMLDEVGAGEDLAVDGDLDVRGSLVLQGSGQPLVNAAGLNDRVLHVGPPGFSPALSISGLGLRGGAGVARGGGVLVEGGTVTMTSVTVGGNGASNGAGVGQGGGIWIDAGTGHSITGSTLDANSATGTTGAEGAGLGIATGVGVSLTNSTISGNTASTAAGSAEGGGIWSAGSPSLTHVTMSENAVTGPNAEGGLAYAEAGTVAFRATILNRGIGESGAENCDTGTGGFTSFGSNLEADNTPVTRQCGTFGAGDLFTGDALVADLADRGGPTQTHALLNFSPALDVISSCFPVSTDQRGEPRPGAFACDIGSFERQVLAPTGSNCLGKAPTIIGFSKSEKIVGTPRDDVIVADAGNDKVKGGEGDDRICGGKGKDRLRGGPGRDRIDGEHGRDELYGQAGRDDLRGGSGRDVLDGGRDVDKLNGGNGIDNCRAGPADKVKAC